MSRQSRIPAIAAAAVLLAAIGTAACAQDSSAVYVPSQTAVAVLPVINLSGERTPKFAEGQAAAVSRELHKQFADRGFHVLDDQAVTDAIASCKADLNDEEQYSRQTFASIGAAAKADLVVFVTIDKVSWKLNQGFFSANTEGHAKITAWLIDVKQQTPLLSAKRFENKYGGGTAANVLFGATEKGSRQIEGACAGVVRDALAEPLKPYPAANQKSSPDKKQP
jgi:TolB-like protein